MYVIKRVYDNKGKVAYKLVHYIYDRDGNADWIPLDKKYATEEEAIRDLHYINGGN